MDSKHIILAAHRGDKKNFPENTMPAFVAAYEAGMDMIETDIHMTKDGELIIMHDRSARRTTGVDRFVTDMTLDEIRELDAGALFSDRFKGTHVPTVREFAEWIRDTGMLINWELKDYPKDVGEELAFAAADRLIALVEEYRLGDRSMFNSFSDRVLEHIYKQHGHRYPIHGQGIYRAKKTNDVAQTPEEEIFTWCCLYSEESGKLPIDFPDNFHHCVEHGIKPCVCLADTEEIYRRAIDLGCRMFTSNDIHEANRILKLFGER